MASLKEIRLFIQTHNQQDKVGVDSVGGKHVVVNNFGAGRDETTYVCQSLADAAGCVRHIVLGIPIIVEVP